MPTKKCVLHITMKIIVKYAVIWSFSFGALLAVLFFHITKKEISHKHTSFMHNYDQWFTQKKLQRVKLSVDTVQYGLTDKVLMENEYLYNNIKILCILLMRKKRNVIAANSTWAKSCNGVTLVHLTSKKVHKTLLPIRLEKTESSWHLLCDAIRNVDIYKYQWMLFVNDDTFAVPENIRYMVAGLNSSQGHYLGHSISFWGVKYNLAQAGYVLSRGSIRLLQQYFNSSEACVAGGRFWKQEDWYLGRHLHSLGVTSVDTRDSRGLSTFHGYNLGKMLFPGSLTTFANYYKHSVYPTVCCSPHSVTFQTIEADKMYLNYYLLYGVQIFYKGFLGNVPAPTFVPEQEVWQTFVRSQGLLDINISAENYYKLWQNIVNDPAKFNEKIRASLGNVPVEIV